MATNRTWEILEIQAPKKYKGGIQQDSYSTEYINGRLCVENAMHGGPNGAETVLQVFRYLMGLGSACIEGYLDGMKDELVFQHEHEEKEFFAKEEEAP